MQFPLMIPVRQHFPAETAGDVTGLVRKQLQHADLQSAITPGARIAIASGSRGIANIATITRTVVDYLTKANARPFILPAMGSHGGANPEGQKALLAGYGISAQSMGVPVEASMEVVEVDRLEDGTPVLINKLAMEADGVILINRIKPHTSFKGPFESGLMKMMTIGLGSHRGASIAHARGPQGLAQLIPAWGKAILRKAPILMGLAILENAYDQTARIVALSPDEFERREPLLLEEARRAMPRILVRNIDLLIVEQIGKDISGTGMDTNVIGRMMLPGIEEPEEPGVSRIVALDLTDNSHGNANGVGLADIITRRLFNRIDFKATYANVFTTTLLNRANIPVIMDTDRQAIEAVLQILGLEEPAQARIARLKNTLEVSCIQLSQPLFDEFRNHPHIEQLGDPQPLSFAADGSLR